MKSQTVITKPDIEQSGAAIRVPPNPPAIAMAAFFISAALIMMFS